MRLVGGESDTQEFKNQGMESEFCPKYIGFQRKHRILVFKGPGYLKVLLSWKSSLSRALAVS